MTERAYKYCFYPTAAQENLLRRTIGCVRLVYNKALATRTQGWSEKQEESFSVNWNINVNGTGVNWSRLIDFFLALSDVTIADL